jgi:hypothetical protein
VTYPARAQKAMSVRRQYPFQQFGTTDDESTRGGADGCTHTVLRYLSKLWLNRWYSQDQISVLAGWSSGARPGRGLYPSEVQRFCTRVGLPYQVRFGLTAFQLLELSERGPIGFGHKYDWWPEWRGYTYFGRTSDGYPNGYAGPLGRAGRTQLAGFTGAHFGILLGWDNDQASNARRVAAWEPNHNSPSRPEDPAYDLITSHQFRVVYESYNRQLKRSPYALVPVRSLPL